MENVITGENLKKARQYFARIVERYERYDNLSDAVQRIKDELVSFSNDERYRILKLRPVKERDDLLGYFFNQKNELPLHIYQWLNVFYMDYEGHIYIYKGHHPDMCRRLQQLYITNYRWRKESKKEDQDTEKQRRKRICKSFSSCKYAATFSIYKKNILNYIDEEELDNLEWILPDLFGDSILNTGGRYVDDFVAGYIIGRIQGRSEREENVLCK